VTILEVQTGAVKPVLVEPLRAGELSRLTSRRFSFSWKKEKKYEIRKLTIVDNEEILGVVSLDIIDEEQRIEIRLLACSIENIGSQKQYSGIASCLIAYVCREAIKLYGENACVSLIPKTLLHQHYIIEYGMKPAGQSLCLIGPDLINMILKHEK
jgi:hypothetical protein